jgi:hypothetical protein
VPPLPRGTTLAVPRLHRLPARAEVLSLLVSWWSPAHPVTS